MRSAARLCLVFGIILSGCASSDPEELSPLPNPAPPVDSLSFADLVVATISDDEWRCGILGADAGALAGYRAAIDLGDAVPEGVDPGAVLRAGEVFARAMNTPSPSGALLLFREADEILGGHAAPRNNIGICLLSAGEVDLAEDSFDAAISSDPYFQPAQDNLDRMLSAAFR